MKDLLDSTNTAKVALGVSFIAFCGILINVLYANHFNAKKRRYDGRKDCCSVINHGISSAFKATTREETFACEIQILYGLIDLKRTQDTRSLYESFREYWYPEKLEELEMQMVPSQFQGKAAVHIRRIDIDVCSMYAFCFEELRQSGVRMQCLPLVDYLSKYYDVHFPIPDRENPFLDTHWTFRSIDDEMIDSSDKLDPHQIGIPSQDSNGSTMNCLIQQSDVTEDMDTHIKKLKQSVVHIRFKREKRAASKANPVEAGLVDMI